MAEGLRFVVRGRVQGVFFRDSTRKEAEELGIAGWVRNRVDGAVEGVAVGDASSLEQLRRFLEHGPPRARVDHLEVEALDAPPSSDRFEVRY